MYCFSVLPIQNVLTLAVMESIEQIWTQERRAHHANHACAAQPEFSNWSYGDDNNTFIKCFEIVVHLIIAVMRKQREFFVYTRWKN